MARGFFKALDRLGLVKYALATLFTVLAFVLTAGAYLVDELSRRPPQVKKLPAAWLAGPEIRETPGWAVRAPVSHTVRYSAASEAPAGFAFYDIAAGETPQSLAAKLVRKHFQVSRVRGESCDFAQPLAGNNAPDGAVAGFIRDRGRDCCAVFSALPRQLATYGFGSDRRSPAGAISGTAVFSDLGAGLLTLTMRFADRVDGYAAAVSSYLSQHLGRPADLPGNGRAWSRDGGLVTVSRTGHGLVVTAYYAANIERHASLARDLADRRSRPDARPGGRLAMATTLGE